MFKKTLLAFSVVAMLGMVACGDEDGAPTGTGTGDTTGDTAGDTDNTGDTGDGPADDIGEGDTGGEGGEATYTDTIFGMSVVHPEGWTVMNDSVEGLTSTVVVTGEVKENAVITFNRVAKPAADEADPWPQADIIGAMFEDGKEADYSLAKMEMIEIEYKVISADAGVQADDGGISFKITKDFETGIPDAGWASFHAIMTSGFDPDKLDADGFVTDTLGLDEFFISYESDMFAKDTKLSSEEGQAFLATANGFAIGMESETWDADQNLEIEIKSIKFFGNAGFKDDMKIVNIDD
jgi:hypothetical protein